MNNEEMENEVVETEAVESASAETKAAGSKKKFKILLVIDIVLIIGLFVMMMCKKSAYAELVQTSNETQLGVYRASVDETRFDLWKSVDQYNMAWNLVYATLTSNRTVAAFDANVKAIEGDKDSRMKQATYIYRNALLNIYNSESILNKALAEYAEKGLADNFLLKNEDAVKQVACGKNCVVTFNFEGKKLKSVDYDALKKYNVAETFKMGEPAPFHFE